MRFWDTSAVLPLIVEEPWTRNARTFLEADAEIMLWWGTPIECLSALARCRRDGRLDAASHKTGQKVLEALLDAAFEIQASDLLRKRASRLLERYPLRLPESFQLAAALTWCDKQPSGFEFVCLDDSLREAAFREGFDVLPYDTLDRHPSSEGLLPFVAGPESQFRI